MTIKLFYCILILMDILCCLVYLTLAFASHSKSYRIGQHLRFVYAQRAKMEFICVVTTFHQCNHNDLN